MIRHIVMWKLKDHAEGTPKDENIRRMKAALEALPSKIPFIREFRIGVNARAGDTSWDMVLSSGFESWDDLAAYQDHPAHLEVGKFVGKVRSERAIVDYED